MSGLTSGATQQNPRIPFLELYFGDQLVPVSTLDARTPSNTPPSTDALSVLFSSFSYTLQSRGEGNQLDVSVIDPTWDGLEQRLQKDRESFSFRFGWRSVARPNRREDADASPPISMYVTNWTPEFLGGFGGSKVTVHAYDHSVALTQTVGRKSFNPAVLVSTAIEQTILDFSGRLGIADKVTVEIEPTVNAVGQDFQRMLGETPLSYVHRLLKIAKAAGDQGSYTITALPTPTGTKVKIGPPPIKADFRRSYLFARDRMGEVLRFAPKYEGIQVAGFGGKVFEALYFDPDTKTVRRVLSRRQEDSALAPYYDDGDNILSRTVPVPFMDTVAAESYADSRRRQGDFLMNEAELTVIGDPEILPFDQVQIILLKASAPRGPIRGDEPIHHLSGVYQVYNVLHTIEAGIYHTNMSLRRTAAYTGVDRVSQLAENLGRALVQAAFPRLNLFSVTKLP